MSDLVTAFRAAEQALFDHHRLQVRERWLDLETPRMRARVLECGEGTPLLHVHGGGALGAAWVPLAAAMPGRRHVMPDRPGFGLSDFVPLDLDFRKHAVDFLVSTLDGLGLDRVDVVANSMGGLWSLWLALDRPERVRSLALLGAPAFVGGGSAPMPMRLLGKSVIGPLMMMLEPPSPKQVRVLWQRMGHDPSTMHETMHALMLATERLPSYAPAWRALLARVLDLSGPRPDVVFRDRDLAAVRAPIAYVWGARDPFGDATFGRSVAEKTPRATFAVAGIGHLPWLDDARACAAAISPSLRDNADRVAT